MNHLEPPPASTMGKGRKSTSQANVQAEDTVEAQLTATIAIRDQLILEHLPLVKAIAVRMHQNLPASVCLDDMVQNGIVGLFHAASKYDSEKQVVFSGYAKHRIKGAILDSLRQLDWASRDMRRRQRQLQLVTVELTATLQRAPIETELAERLGIDVKRLRGMMIDLRTVGPVSASTSSGAYEDLPPPDLPGKVEEQPDFICARAELRSALRKAVEVLPERYRKIVLLYYYNEMNMKEIGAVLGINESRVSQIHKSALGRMGTALKTLGIDGNQCILSPNARILAFKI
jgi:RNA polymerase sigma factor FliA